MRDRDKRPSHRVYIRGTQWQYRNIILTSLPGTPGAVHLDKTARVSEGHPVPDADFTEGTCLRWVLEIDLVLYSQTPPASRSTSQIAGWTDLEFDA